MQVCASSSSSRFRNISISHLARKFHELNQAYELLLDPLRRMALDAKLRIKEARKARFSQYDNKRKNLVEELEERERAFKKAKTDKEEKQKQVWRDNERIMEEGRLMRETREKELLRREEEAQAESKRMKAELEPPALGMFIFCLFSPYELISCGCVRHSRYYHPSQMDSHFIS